jgi:hypothetical protein
MYILAIDRSETQEYARCAGSGEATAVPAESSNSPHNKAEVILFTLRRCGESPSVEMVDEPSSVILLCMESFPRLKHPASFFVCRLDDKETSNHSLTFIIGQYSDESKHFCPVSFSYRAKSMPPMTLRMENNLAHTRSTRHQDANPGRGCRDEVIY